MNNKKQKLLVEYLISSTDTFALCKSIVEPDYFDPDLRPAVEFIHEFYDKYHTTPNATQVEAETNCALTIQTLTKADINYCADQIEVYCRRKAIEKAVRSAPKMIDSGDFGLVETMIKQAVAVSLNRSLGMAYFDNPLQRLEEQSKVPLRTSTGWTSFDELLAGGLARGEIILFSANSGGGKSITLANMAINFLKQKLNVLYISLELSEELIGQRFDTMYTGVSSIVAQAKYREIAKELSQIAPDLGKLYVKYMPAGTNSNAIRAYLKEFELKTGYLPDLLIVDYLDIMGSNERISAEFVFEKDKAAAEQLRALGMEFKMFVATASQQNRNAVTATELNHSHIAGGISKINTVDWYVSILMNAVLKASGEIGFLFLKTRSSDGVGKTVYMNWDNNRLLISDKPKEVRPSEKLPTLPSQRTALTLAELMDNT